MPERKGNFHLKKATRKKERIEGKGNTQGEYKKLHHKHSVVAYYITRGRKKKVPRWHHLYTALLRLE